MTLQPIPASATPRDPHWLHAFLTLAQGLVVAGAKAKIIVRFTGFYHSQIKEMYKALRGTRPPPGPIVQASATYFARPSKRSSAATRIQYIIFLGCYSRLSQGMTIPVHRGWLLLSAYNSYLSLTQPLYETTAVKRLNINQAYALLTYCGFMEGSNVAALRMRQCPDCSINYPVTAKDAPDSDVCPVCAISANFQRLAEQSSRNKSEAAVLRKP